MTNRLDTLFHFKASLAKKWINDQHMLAFVLEHNLVEDGLQVVPTIRNEADRPLAGSRVQGKAPS